jgi:hypothetical protein
VTAPAATVCTVPVTLETVESEATHAAPARGSFTYTQPPKQTVKVHRSGNGSGKVTSSPKGISCGKTCSHKFVFGTAVTVKAKASKGSSFGGWTGACRGRSRCKVKANAARSITAKFTLKSCVVPKVTGKTLSGAKRTLKAHSCRVGKVKQAVSSTVKKGRVISQKPQRGKHLRHGGKVALTVSKGK